MSATGRSDVRVAGDFYATPAWVTRAILPHLPTCGKILDAGSGAGAISHEVRKFGVMASCILGVELDPELAAKGTNASEVIRGDYITVTREDLSPEWLDLGLVISNPPFSLAQAFVQRSLDLARPTRATVAVLLRLAFLESKKRAKFHRENPSDVFVLTERPSFTGDGKSDSCAYAWLVWGPGRGNRWSILDGSASEVTS